MMVLTKSQVEMPILINQHEAPRSHDKSGCKMKSRILGLDTYSMLVIIAIAAAFLFPTKVGFSQIEKGSEKPSEDATVPTKTVESSSSSSSSSSSPAVSPTQPMATGRVFLDLDNDKKFGENDQPFVNIRVSNGREIVTTDSEGRWKLPVEEDAIYFLIKPSGYQASLDEDKLPQFYYIHKPNGSPKLKFAGSKPTGPLPLSIDFPLYRSEEQEDFRILLFGDPQPRNKQEVDYAAHDVISELVGTTSATFGVTLGDIAFDNLETLEPFNQAVAMIGIPWHNVIGNHDINLDAKTRKHVNETFESIYGPTYYSFDYGQVHFVVLDNIDWGEVKGRKRYIARFGERQLEFLKNDLASLPESQMVVLLMHIPILDCKDHQEVFRLIEKRPFCVSVSAHRHVHTHQFIGKEQGWQGEKEHHHIVNVTVSGNWWSGLKNDRGIPHTTMADGAPNGYSMMSFANGKYTMEFKGAGLPASEQMLIQTENELTTKEDSDFWVNVYNGSSKSTVEFAVDDSTAWKSVQQVAAFDPNFVRMRKMEQELNPPVKPKLAKPALSTHLWKGQLKSGLKPGTHLLRVKTTDMHGRVFYGQRSFRVVE